MPRRSLSLIAIVVLTCGVASLMAQQTGRATAAPAPPPSYVIGPADVLSIVFWRDKDMSADVVCGLTAGSRCR